MSTTEAAELIIEAKAAGLKLVPDGEALRVRGPAEALERFTPALREHKPELMRLLADQAEAAPAAPQEAAETYVNLGWCYRSRGYQLQPSPAPQHKQELLRLLMLTWSIMTKR